jgi:gluconolactonase
LIPELSSDQFSIFASGVDHPECVAFDRKGNLWAGGEAGQVYRIDPKGRVQTIASLESFNGGLAFSPADELFVCNPVKGIVRVQPDGASSIFTNEGPGQKLICPNFGLFDEQGNYYVSDSGNFRKRNGRVLRFDSTGKGELIAGPVGYANGMALSQDGRSLFWIESDTNSVFVQEITNETCSAPRLFAADCGRFPDGLALDVLGNLYVSCYASDEIWKLSSKGEKTLFAWDPWAIVLGSPTNMAFGGPEMNELYIANLARTTITRVKVPTPGLPLVNLRS